MLKDYFMNEFTTLKGNCNYEKWFVDLYFGKLQPWLEA